MKMKTADIGMSILLLILCALGYVETYHFTEQAALLPRITFGCIAALAGVQLVKAFFKSGEKIVRFQWKRVLTIVGLTVAYVILIPILGYWIATVLFIFCAMFAFGVRNKVALAAVSVGFAVFVYVIFVRVLSLNPPAPFFMQ